MSQARLVTVSAAALLSLLAACAPGPPQVADTPENRSSAAAALAQLEIDDGGLDKVLDDGAEAGLSYAAEPLSEDLGRELTSDESARVRAILRSSSGRDPDTGAVAAGPDRGVRRELHRTGSRGDPGIFRDAGRPQGAAERIHIVGASRDRGRCRLRSAPRRVHRTSGRTAGRGVRRAGRRRDAVIAARVRRSLVGAAALIAMAASSVSPVAAQSGVAQSVRYGEVLEVRRVVIKTGPKPGAAQTGATVGAVAGYALADGRDRWLGALVGGALGGAAGKSRSKKKRPGFELIIRVEKGGEEIAIKVRGSSSSTTPGTASAS